MQNSPTDPPVVIEHTTVNPVVERTSTIIERDSWYGEPWAIALMLGVIVVIGIIAYWGFANNSQPAVVESSTTRIEHDTDGRAQTMAPSSPVIVNTPASTPNINVTPPANNPTINVTPPANNSTINVNPPADSNSNPSNGSDHGTNPNNGGSPNSGSGQ